MVVSTESISSADAALRLLHAALAFEGERLGDDGDGQRAHFARQRGDDGRRARAGAAAETGGDENHVRAFEGFDDLVGIFERSFAADFRIGARAQPVGELHAELDFHRRTRHAQRLQVGVGNDELDAFHAGVDHAVDGVVAASTHADDLDLGVVAGVFVEADANVVFFFHVRRLLWILSCSVLICRSRLIPQSSAGVPPVVRWASALPSRRPYAGATKVYAPLPTNMAFSFEPQPSF